MLIQIKIGNTKIFLDYSLLQPRTGIWIERGYGKSRMIADEHFMRLNWAGLIHFRQTVE